MRKKVCKLPNARPDVLISIHTFPADSIHIIIHIETGLELTIFDHLKQ